MRPADPTSGTRALRAAPTRRCRYIPASTNQYGGIEYAGLPINYCVLLCRPTVLAYRAKPRNAILSFATTIGHEVLVSPDEDDTVDCHSAHGNVRLPGGHRTLGHASDAREERCRK
jgi:hypothetical protein